MKISLSGSHEHTRKKRRIRLTGVIFLVVFTVLIAGCFLLWFRAEDSKEPIKTLDSEKTVKQESVIHDPKIGLLLPLSGPFQKEGELLRDGIELAWKELQQKGVQGQLVVRDAGRNARETLKLAESMARDPDLVVFIAHLPTRILAELAPMLERQNLLAILPANSHQQLTQYPSMLPLVCLDEEEGAYAATIAKSWAEKDTAVVVHDSSTYGELLFESFLQEAQEIQLTTAEFSTDADEFSLSTTIDEILQERPEVIWLAGSPFWGVRIINTLVEKGYVGRFLAPRSYGGPFIEDLLGDYLDQLYVLRSALVIDEDDSVAKEFTKKFRERYWREPQRLAVLGYDAMNWLGLLLRKGPLKRSSVHDFFLSYDSSEHAYSGLAGPIYFDSEGKPQRQLQVMTYQDGRFVPIQQDESGAKPLNTASAKNSGKDK